MKTLKIECGHDTMAQMVSSLFRDDGRIFCVGALELGPLCEWNAQRIEHARYGETYSDFEIVQAGSAMWGDVTRYVFEDGSAIIECADWWAIEADRPFYPEGGE